MGDYDFTFDGEAWVEDILGSFDPPGYADNVTIGCRYGYVDGQPDAAASLFTPTRCYTAPSIACRRVPSSR